MFASPIDEAASQDIASFDRSVTSHLLIALMDRVECGLLACGPMGELLHANLAAQRALREASILRLVDACVCASACKQDAWIAALRNAATRRRSSLVEVGDGESRTMLAVMPGHADIGGEPGVIVVMGRRSPCSALGLEMFAGSHGLTHAESRVLRALVDNRSTREIAASHGVAVATVRSQIQAVRDKLGVRSIDALLLRAAEVPPVTARH